MANQPVKRVVITEDISGTNIPRESTISPSRHSDTKSKVASVSRRVSKAKKGQFVHVCEICTPPRVFSRAEHLRRHQLGHGEPKFFCSFAQCSREFHRADLLARHESRHGRSDSISSNLRPNISLSAISQTILTNDQKSTNDVHFASRQELPSAYAGEYDNSDFSVVLQNPTMTRSHFYATNHNVPTTVRTDLGEDQRGTAYIYGGSLPESSSVSASSMSHSPDPAYAQIMAADTHSGPHGFDMAGLASCHSFPSYQLLSNLSSDPSNLVHSSSSSGLSSFVDQDQINLSNYMPCWSNGIPIDYYRAFLAASDTKQSSAESHSGQHDELNMMNHFLHNDCPGSRRSVDSYLSHQGHNGDLTYHENNIMIGHWSSRTASDLQAPFVPELMEEAFAEWLNQVSQSTSTDVVPTSSDGLDLLPNDIERTSYTGNDLASRHPFSSSDHHSRNFQNEPMHTPVFTNFS